MGIATFRLDKELEAEINRIAVRERKTKTQVVWDALREYTIKKRTENPVSMADAMKNYVGSGKSKRRRLSSQTGKTMWSLLIEKKKSGRL